MDDTLVPPDQDIDPSLAALSKRAWLLVVDHEAINPAVRPASIENDDDERHCVPSLLDQVRVAAAGPDATHPDAYAVACFGDPGLDEVRNLVDIPVLAIDSDPDTVGPIGDRCEAAVAADGRAAIVLGCAATALAEALVRLDRVS